MCGYGDHTLQTITGATNASPIVVTSAAHGLVTGNRVLIADVLGNTNTNGAWNITKVTDNTFSLDGSTGNAAYTSGGTLVHLEVPEPIRHAIKLILSDMYEHRQSIYSGVNVAEIPGHIMNLLWDYRIWL